MLPSAGVTAMSKICKATPLGFEDKVNNTYKIKNHRKLDAAVIVDILTANNKGEEVYETAWLERKLEGDESYRDEITASLERIRHLLDTRYNHMVVIWDPNALPPQVAVHVVRMMAKQGTPLYGSSSPPDLGVDIPLSPRKPAKPGKGAPRRNNKPTRKRK